MSNDKHIAVLTGDTIFLPVYVKAPKSTNTWLWLVSGLIVPRFYLPLRIFDFCLAASGFTIGHAMALLHYSMKNLNLLTNTKLIAKFTKIMSAIVTCREISVLPEKNSSYKFLHAFHVERLGTLSGRSRDTISWLNIVLQSCFAHSQAKYLPLLADKDFLCFWQNLYTLQFF